MSMEVLCCILMLACCVMVYIQIRLEDNWYYGAIYEAERIRYERACKEEAMTRKEATFYIRELERLYASMDKKVAEAVDMAIEALENERPKGNWNFAGDNMFRCTECGVLYTYTQLEHLKKHTTDSTFPNFCPQCGADMRGEVCERDTDWEQAITQLEHDMRYDPTYNPEDGSA